ncbi:hypothetical protein [Allosediminivita pacifica]|uniref:DUF1127 domain-containing protein n=1 Tax=Allosediminivita pacifica TaxID=1267769 RepID=A0A2T6AQF5_9RHOB|nr:hypothetical protein [Allosediminivita pacifica]PTX46058.1 hypothetical protein C8N44_11833 [Allosediminivita pacifica]GGB18660.1 hypothetical protein GCM10011324_31010 [Allosediminivita pacifica]
MAFYDDLMTRERPSLRNWVARIVETPFDRRQRQLASQVEALRSKSDAQLAELGLQREDILFHVFGAGRR